MRPKQEVGICHACTCFCPTVPCSAHAQTALCESLCPQKTYTYYDKRWIAFPLLALLPVQQLRAPFNFNQFNPIQTWIRLSFLNFIPIGVVTLGCNLVCQSHRRAFATDFRHIHSTLLWLCYAIYASISGYGHSSAKSEFSWDEVNPGQFLW